MGKFEGTAVPLLNSDSGGDPLAYNPATRKFTVDTDDFDLLDETIEKYQVYATFTTYPPTTPAFSGVSTFESENQINFGNPCLDPFTF